MINTDLLLDYGAIRKKFGKGQVIFGQGQPAFYYFQIVEGMVKMVNIGEDQEVTLCFEHSHTPPPPISSTSSSLRL